MKVKSIPASLEPRLIQMSFTINADGVGEYHVVQQQNAGTRIKDENWGYAYPSCEHLRCRWVNLAASAYEWADLIVPHQGQSQVHPQQLGLMHPPQ